MPRPRVYDSEEARKEAARASHCRYYVKHRERINAKRSKPSTHLTSDDDDEVMDLTTLPECLAVVKYAKDELVAYAPVPRDFVRGILMAYIDSIPDESDDDDLGEVRSFEGDLSIIETALRKVEEIFARANKGHIALWEICGTCSELRATEQVCGGVKRLIIMLEDILCLAMEGTIVIAKQCYILYLNLNI